MDLIGDLGKYDISSFNVRRELKLEFIAAVKEKHGKSWGNIEFEVEAAIRNHIKVMRNGNCNGNGNGSNNGTHP